MQSVIVRTIPAGQTHPLRHRVLRPHEALAEMHYPGDTERRTIHLGAFVVHGHPPEPIGVVTLSVEPMLTDPREGDYRLRGMAVDVAFQGGGIGGLLVREGVEAARHAGGLRVWCNARMAAAAFYERAGFVRVGLPFEIEGIGTHVRMTLGLATRDCPS